MQKSSSEINMNKQSLMPDNLWGMSEQLIKPALQLPTDPPLVVLAGPGPLVTTQRSARKNGDRNKGKGKGKDMNCRSYMETGKCTRGEECWFAKTTIGHP
eukprot:629374-Pyramimonas_sp.AAC.1